MAILRGPQDVNRTHPLSTFGSSLQKVKQQAPREPNRTQNEDKTRRTGQMGVTLCLFETDLFATGFMTRLSQTGIQVIRFMVTNDSK